MSSPEQTLDLFAVRLQPASLRFDGETYQPAKDEARLTGQLLAVRTLMADGKPRSLAEIAYAVQGTEASVSARLRDLRKKRFGALQVDRTRVEGGLFHYQLRIP